MQWILHVVIFSVDSVCVFESHAPNSTVRRFMRFEVFFMVLLCEPFVSLFAPMT